MLKNGVPAAEIDALSHDEMQAYCIILGEFEGNRFDWSKGQWVRPA